MKLSNRFLKFFLIILFQFITFSSYSNTSALTLPSPETRRSMVLNLSQEILRLDGDGLLPRANRPESWEVTIQRLANEASEAKTLYDLGRVFKRVDATYPNLHASVYMIPQLEELKSEQSLSLPFVFYPVNIDKNFKISNFKIMVKKGMKTDLQNGDEIISINSRSLQEWTDENFIFCKFPYREQCEIEFYDNFIKELLGWNHGQSLELRIKRGKEVLNISVELGIRPINLNKNVSMSLPCDVYPSRYKSFKLVFQGENLCAFESFDNSNIVTLRIKSFSYKDSAKVSLSREVELFWKKYWQKKSPKVKTLILDVLDNSGGDSPIPYYGLFYARPYQEQFVQFKKIEEFERPDILESHFWNSNSKKIWFKRIKKQGEFLKVKKGDFLSQVPQFCADDKKDCSKESFLPKINGFKGEVKILMDQWCISSCVGFVYNIKNLLKERVKTYGMPDSGDSTYSRLTISISPNTKAIISSWKKAQAPGLPEPWIRQIVSATRTTDKDGKILSGIPQVVDVWVPRSWNQSSEEWESSVFNKGMEIK